MRQKQQKKVWKKNLIKYRVNRIFTILIFLFLVNGLYSQAASTEENGMEGELSSRVHVLLLFDKSKSMLNSVSIHNTDQEQEAGTTYGEMAADWVRDICALVSDNNIEMEISFFDGGIDIKNGEQKLTRDNCQSVFENLVFNGEYTDQNQAFQESVKQLAGKEGHKYIILLSDGDLDLDNNPQKETDEEKQSIEKFREGVLEQAQSGEYTIILIGLGKKVQLYEGLDQLKTVKCYNQRSDLEELRILLLNDMGYVVHPLDLEGSTFYIDKKYDRCVVRAEYFQEKDKINAVYLGIEERNKYTLYCNLTAGEKKEINGALRQVECFSLPAATYIYLDNPGEGTYGIDGFFASIRVDCIEKRFINEVKVILEDKEKREYEKTEEDGYVNYMLDKSDRRGESFQIIDNIHLRIKIDTDLPPSIEGYYYLNEIDSPEQWYEGDVSEKGKEYHLNNFIHEDQAWIEKLDVEPGKNYICTVNLSTVHQGNISKSIFFTVPEVGDIIQSVYLSGTIDRIYSREEYLLPDYNVSCEDLILVYNGYNIIEDGKNMESVLPVQVNDKQEISFQRSGKYTIEVKENDVVKQKIYFDISSGGEDRKIKISFVIAGVIILILIFGVLLKHKA